MVSLQDPFHRQHGAVGGESISPTKNNPIHHHLVAAQNHQHSRSGVLLPEQAAGVNGSNLL